MEENIIDDQIYIPQVVDDRKPKVGMEFTSIEDAFSFYNQYAREAGFSARISNSKKDKGTNEVVWKKFICFKEGRTSEWNNQAKVGQEKQERTRGGVRTGCKSRINKPLQESRYDVINFQCSSSKPRFLMHDKLKDYISFSCTKFDFEGIPCRHMLAFFRINQVFQLPDKYILKRWTQDAKVGVTFVMCEENVNNDRERFLMSRHSRLSFKASVLVDEASLTDEGTKFLDEQFDHIYTKIKYINSSRTFDGRNLRKRTMDGARGVIDPAEIRTKGRGKRMKSSKEKSTLKSRQCRGCGLRGVSHDKCNCPKLQDGSVSLNLCMFYSFFPNQ
ncbi:protein FAR-RED IMPAIRED RESPONSE 1-like [Dorcoceras hygrometricum]|uniref:Protein FAR1-RELATED SEQUENCE n=1 Tax=Dorcoceras hygrometricum TaxID=472368 RepID=A0A2Z7AEB9_9LAMI|nr:protein FAR-RED IMPAIRED RESPONSE 1-like [Dorcoceras hygrometricum]